MKRLIALLAFAASAWAADPLEGKWRLDTQEKNGQKTNSEAMVLQVTPAGDRFEFRFSLPVNNIYFVSMSYTVRLDGSEGDVKNSHGEKVGTVQITRAGASQYKLTIRGPNRPASTGTLTVSPDGKKLTSESSSDAVQPVHVKQLFSRYN